MTDSTTPERQPSFTERAHRMLDSAHKLVALSDELLAVSDFLCEEAARMKAASERFAKKRDERRAPRPRR